MATNFYPTKTIVIAVSGTTGNAVELEEFEIMGLDIPTLDSATFKLQASLDGGTTFRDIYDGLGNQILNMPASTGNRVIGSRDLADLCGYTHIKAVLGSAQNTGARTITFYGKHTQH